MKDGLRRELLVRLTNPKKTGPFERIHEEKTCLKTIPVLSIDPEESDEDENIIVD